MKYIEPAREASLRALSLKPDLASAHVSLANLYMWTGKHDIASHELDIALQFDQFNPAYAARAIFYAFRDAMTKSKRPCNMTADMLSIMRSAFTLQRALVNQRAISGEKNVPRLLTSRDVIELATIEGARTAHLDSKIGTLTPGKEADIILLATDRINVFPLNNVPGTVATLMGTSNVDTVFIAGKVMKWQGKLVGIDPARLKRDIEKSRDGLLARAKFSRNVFGSCCTQP